MAKASGQSGGLFAYAPPGIRKPLYAGKFTTIFAGEARPTLDAGLYFAFVNDLAYSPYFIAMTFKLGPTKDLMSLMHASVLDPMNTPFAARLAVTANP